MTYYFSVVLDMPFEQAIIRVKEELQKEGFGIVTEVNFKEKLKEKLGVDFRNYMILGACNPKFAYSAMQVEDKIGVMLPCNVVVQSTADGKVEIAAVDPVASMMAIQNPDLEWLAKEVQARMKAVISRL